MASFRRTRSWVHFAAKTPCVKRGRVASRNSGDGPKTAFRGATVAVSWRHGRYPGVMAKTDAERSAAYRERRSGRVAELRASVATLEAVLADRERQLGEALAEVERLLGAQCRHPAEAVDAGTCRACGADIW
jgi:hypothetical protein